jgi:hypothetical protein
MGRRSRPELSWGSAVVSKERKQAFMAIARSIDLVVNEADARCERRIEANRAGEEEPIEVGVLIASGARLKNLRRAMKTREYEVVRRVPTRRR